MDKKEPLLSKKLSPRKRKKIEIGEFELGMIYEKAYRGVPPEGYTGWVDEGQWPYTTPMTWLEATRDFQRWGDWRRVNDCDSDLFACRNMAFGVYKFRSEPSKFGACDDMQDGFSVYWVRVSPQYYPHFIANFSKQEDAEEFCRYKFRIQPEERDWQTSLHDDKEWKQRQEEEIVEQLKLDEWLSFHPFKSSLLDS